MCAKRYKHSSSQRGVSLVELVVFIVIVGVAVSGVLMVLMQTTRNSVDPMVYKQALSIAESLLEEVQLQPFTYCDPDDPAAASAANPAACATAENLGPEGAEDRYASSGAPFDNVSDYHGYNSASEAPPGIKDITGAAIGNLTAYNASVTVTQVALGGIAATETLRIAVTVTGPANTIVSLEGYRTRHAPNALP